MKPRSMSALGGGSTLNGCLGQAGTPTRCQARVNYSMPKIRKGAALPASADISKQPWTY